MALRSLVWLLMLGMALVLALALVVAITAGAPVLLSVLLAFALVGSAAQLIYHRRN
jgi:hypothetical protein